MPHALVGTRLEARISDALVELMRKEERVAIHARSEQHGGFTTLDDRQRRPGLVDEQLLPGAVLLAHRAAQRLGVRPVVLAELCQAPGAAALMRGTVFLPEQHQRHALAAQLNVHTPEVGFDHPSLLGAGAEQAPLQLGLAETSDRFPVIQAAGVGQRHVPG